jgi:branched-subunit amino acid ABC-type transport system permease component
MSTYVIQILSGLGSAAVLFLVASGLTLIFGALRIINFAHGALYMIGAYLAVTTANQVGIGNGTFWLTLVVAGVGVMAIGVIMEILFFRRIYDRDVLTQLLVTFAFVLIIEGAVRAIWGSQEKVTAVPPFASGGVTIIGGRTFPIYQLFMMGVAIAAAVLLWLLLYRTVLGRMVRAAVSDAELLALSGVNVRYLFTGVFALGCLFAGVAGAVVAPNGSVGIGLDTGVIIRAFVVIVIGGLGSLWGAFIASIIVGISESLGILWVPQASLAIVFAVLVVVLAIRPQGLVRVAGV